MDQPANGRAPGPLPGTGLITEHLAKLAAQITGPYEARVITPGLVPWLHVVSQFDPDRYDDVLYDFSTDPPDDLTTAGQRLGTAAARPPRRPTWPATWPRLAPAEGDQRPITFLRRQGGRPGFTLAAVATAG